MRLSTLLAALILGGSALAPSQALAWDSEGHRIIARLAHERLTPKAKGEIAALIAHSSEQGTPSCAVASLEDASTWPDCIRPLHGRWEYLARDHFEDVPICMTLNEALAAHGKVSAVYCPDGQCVVDETGRALAVLRNSRRPAVERLQALEEVTHFVGDMHQPLHAADNHDRGGNDVHVMVEGHRSNLHHVWDTEALEYAVGKDEAAAAAALRPLIAHNAAVWARGDLDAWLAETHHIAVAYVYATLAHPPACGAPAPDQAISQTYLEGAAPIVRQQLGRAAVRLARVLNESLSAERR